MDTYKAVLDNVDAVLLQALCRRRQLRRHHHLPVGVRSASLERNAVQSLSQKWWRDIMSNRNRMGQAKQ